MHLHILGICGTFMGGIALLARALGHRVTGSDANVYPPMSTQLREAGIHLMEGFDASHLRPAPDIVVVGNAMRRGLPVVEYMLDQGLPYTSGPEWLRENLLGARWVLAVAGTHGKTSTAGMLAWVLEDAGLDAGFLIGGIPKNFGVSARLGSAPFFIVEADEYDTAFFDKRSEIPSLSAADPGAQQPGVRPCRHLRRPGHDPAPVPPPGTHRARRWTHHPSHRGAGPRPGVGDGLLDPQGNRRGGGGTGRRNRSTRTAPGSGYY